MAVPKKTINDILNPRVVDKEKYISEDINYLKDIINKKAGVIDMMSPGPLKDELRGTYDPTQESYEEFLQRQSIPQMDRSLTGQAPSDAILETQRIDLNEGGVLGPGGMFRGEDLGTREGFAELTPTQLTELKQKYPDWDDKYKFGFPKSDSRYGKIRSIARKEQKAEYNKRPEVSEARREREKTKYQTDLEYREKILEKNRRNAAKLDATLKRQAKQKEYYYKKGGREKALQRLKGVSIEKNYGSYMQNTDNALFKDMVRAAEQDADLKIIRGGPKNQIVGIKEGNKIYHPVGERRQPIPGAPKNSVSIIKHPAFKQRAEMNKAVNTFANTKISGYENLTYKKALDAIQSQVAGTPPQKKNPAEFEHTKGVATDYKKGQFALRTANRDKEFVIKKLKDKIITKPVAIQELKNLGVRAFVDGKYIGAPKIDYNKQINDYKKYVDRIIKNDPTYFNELNQGKVPTKKITFLKEVEPIAGRLQKSMQQKTTGPYKGSGTGAAGYALLGGAVLSPVIRDFLQDTGVMDKPRGVPMASLDGGKYIPEESSFAEDAALTALGGATVLGGGLAGKKLIEKTTGRFAPMIKGAIGKIAMSPFALPFRATGLDRMAMKKLGLLPEDETLAQTYDPRTASGRTTLALEGVAAGAYKPIAERLTSGIKNQTAKSLATGILKLGPRALNLANVLSKAARVTTPLGLTYLLGEGAYHLLIKPQKEYLESLDPEERKTVEQQYADVAAAEGGIIRKAYKDAGLVEKLGRGAAALDPRNIPYYGAKTLKGLGSGVEMAVKFPVAAGAAIGETIQKGPRKETLTKFGEAVQPSATQYLSEKTGLESLIRKQEKELVEKRPGALAMGDVLELGAEFVAPATGYIKMLEDGSSKLYKVIRDGQAGKKVDPKDIDEVLELLSDKGVERRDFMAVVGGTSALALAKHVGIIDALKILEKTKPVRMLSKSASKMPEWFPSFASRILDDTNSVFKQVDEDLVEITNKNLPDVSVGKYSSGRWEISGYNEYGKPYLIDYEPPSILEDGTKYAGDFSVFDNVPSRMGPDDVEFDSELVESIDDVLGGTSKLEEWTTGVKKKNLTPGEKRVIEAEGRAEADYDAWKESDDFVDE
jgi:hypothetical protein